MTIKEIRSVEKNPYRYLFPYEKVPAHSKILIYGAGTLGQDYLYQMLLTNYCEVVAMADKNYQQYPPMIVPVISPDQIHTFSFDYVVIALRMAAAFQEIRRILEKEGVPKDKIICIFEREEKLPTIFLGQASARDRVLSKEQLAFSRSPLSIAILSTGGFGDMVIQKRFVMEIIRLVPECVIDIYNIKALDLLIHLYADCKNVNQVIPDLGNRYQQNHSQYALALTIEACHFIKVDKWKEDAFRSPTRDHYEEFIQCIQKLKVETEKENVNVSTPVHLTMIRRVYQGLNAYTGFNYNGSFHIQDQKVDIPLDEAWKVEFERLHLKNYITVNFGNGDCADSSKIAKSWSKERFECLISLFKDRYPRIQTVQLGAKDSERLAGADQYLLGTDFRMSLYLLKYSLLHVDIEGGLVHIATQLGTKCVVLFGPTVREYYGYKQNINIQAGNCHNCWGLYSDVNRCARDMKEPECMYVITPKMVMSQLEKYMDAILPEEGLDVG